MKPNTTRSIIAKIVMLLYVVAVAYLCFANFHKLPDVPKTFLGIPMDKIVHFCMFFPFPILAFFAYDKLTEIIQGSLPYRSQDIHDFGADLLSIGISGLLVFLYDVSKMKKNKS